MLTAFSVYPLMPMQSELFPPDRPTTPDALQTSPRLSAEEATTQLESTLATPGSEQRAQRRRVNAPIPVWLQRLSLAVMVTFCLYIGVLLACLPWTRFWFQNPYLFTYPRLGHVLLMGATRGIISGIGVMDIWIGLSEAIHYRDARA